METKPLQVLVVDNDPFFLKLLSAMLERNGHIATCTENIFTCLNILADSKPDLIFLDLVMPHLGGDDLCRIIRSYTHLQDTYIVIISAIALEQPVDIYSLGADACIAKGPFNQMEIYVQEVIEESLNPRKEYPLQQVRGHEFLFSRKISQELLKQIEHLRYILRNMSQGIIEIAKNRIVYINDSAAGMVNSNGKEILGSEISDSLPQVLLNALQPIGLAVGVKKKNLPRTTLQYNDRQFIVEQLICQADYPTEIYILSDITEKRRMESIIEAANLTENLGYVFSGIRHEIGNPVNSIKMALSVLQQNLTEYDQETIAEFLNRSLEEISRIEYLLKALRNYSLFETPVVENISLSSFLRDFISLVRNDLAELKIHINTILPDNEIVVCVDSRALHHVLLNLISNAADALQLTENPQLTISCFLKGEMVVIKVDDNGKGISEEDCQHLFKPFFTSKTTGTGLGLAIVKKMLAAMQGTINIESYQGVGTTITLVLPGPCNETESEKPAYY